jgi:hypothetical protein
MDVADEAGYMREHWSSFQEVYSKSQKATK